MSTDDIVAFIKIRLHEDQTVASDALKHWPPGDEIAGQVDSILVGAHVHRQNPHRVLRGVEAKRTALALHAQGHECPSEVGEPNMSGWYESDCPTIRAQASEWSTHDDFRPGWTL